MSPERKRATTEKSMTHKKSMARNVCSSCRKTIEHLPFKCKFCGEIFCQNCHLPENHACPELSTWKAKEIAKTKQRIFEWRESQSRDKEIQRQIDEWREASRIRDARRIRERKAAQSRQISEPAPLKKRKLRIDARDIVTVIIALVLIIILIVARLR